MLLNPKQNRYCNSSGYFYTVPGKTMRKVLGKEFEEEPFFKRVFLNMPHKTAIPVSRLKLPVSDLGSEQSYAAFSALLHHFVCPDRGLYLSDVSLVEQEHTKS